MPRVTEAEVRDIVDASSDIPMMPHIQAASVVIDRVNTCASARGYTLTAAELTELERWLAAHFYVHRDPQYRSRKTSDASGEFDTLNYLETAKSLDPSGCLAAQMERNRAGGFWLGKPKSQQTSYSDRD